MQMPTNPFPIDRIKLGLTDDDSAIIIGRLGISGRRWLEKRECTFEAVDAVRDFMVHKAGYKNSFSYGWKRSDGKNIVLTVAIIEGDDQ